MRRIHVYLLSALFCGCASVEQIAEQSTKANLAVERAHNEILLLNVVRASKNLPLHFTGIASLTGPLGSGRITPTIELSRMATVLSNAIHTPLSRKGTIGFTPDAPNFSIAVYDAQEFMRGFSSGVPPRMLDVLLESGLPRDLVLALLVDEAHASISYAPKNNQVCSSGYVPDDKSKRCTATKYYRNDPRKLKELKDFYDWAKDNKGCRLESTGERIPAPDSVLSSFDADKLIKLRTAGLRLVKDGNSYYIEDPGAAFQLEKRADESCVGIRISQACPEQNGEPESIPSGPKPPVPTPSIRVLRSGIADSTPVSPRLDAPSTNTCQLDAGMRIRSPEAIVRYLGDLVSQSEELKSVESLPFVIARGPESASGAAVAVEFNGEIYSLGPGTSAERSLQSLSILSTLIAYQKKASEQPAVTNIRLLP